MFFLARFSFVGLSASTPKESSHTME